jgi:hypothetical protein
MSPPSPSSSTSKNAANYAGGRRRSHPLALTADLSGWKWKVKRARGRRTETRSHPHFIAAMIRRRVSIPARRKGRAGVFPLPRDSARATRRRPEIAPVRRAQPSSGETNPSRVSPQPGCGVGFGRSWPGATSGQGRKQVRLQPMGARPTWANLTNTPQLHQAATGEPITVCRSNLRFHQSGWQPHRQHRGVMSNISSIDAW